MKKIKFFSNIEIIIVLMVLLIQLLIQTGFADLGEILVRSIGIGNGGNWLSFWASYLVSALTIFFAYIIMKVQLEKSKQNELDNAIKISKLNNSAKLLNVSMDFLTILFKVESELEYNIKREKSNEFKMSNIREVNNAWIDYTSQWNSFATTSHISKIENLQEQKNNLRAL